MMQFLTGAALALAASAASAATGVQVSGWAQPTVAGQSTGAAYLVIRNYGPSADRLVSLASPAAGMVSVHRSMTVGDISRMRAAGAIVVPPGKILTMSPGGYHVMLMGLKAPLKPGTRLPLTVRFEHGGERRLSLPIQMSAPDGRTHQH